MTRAETWVRRSGFLAVLLVGVAGCASEADDGAVGEDEITNERRVTIQNFVMHPRIVEVREAVRAIDAMPLTRSRNDNPCDSATLEPWREKYVGPGGRVRKAVFFLGGEHGWGTTTLYFSEKGKLRFAFDDGGGWVGQEDWRIQKRVYFNEAGERFFEVHRKVLWQSSTEDGEPTGVPEPNVNEAPYSAPEPVACGTCSEFDLSAEWEKDPASAYDAPHTECF